MTEQTKKGSLGDILSASQIITPADISAALAEQARCGCRFGEALVSLGVVTQEDIDWALSNQLDLPYIRLKQEMIDPEALRLIPAALARKFNLIPLIRAGSELNVAMADPLNSAALDAARQACGCQINVSVALLREIRELIEACYGSAGQECLGFESASFSVKALDAINADLSGAQLLDYLLLFIQQNRLATLSLQPLGSHISISGRRSGVTRPIGTLMPRYYPDACIRIRKSAGIVPSGDRAASGLLTLNHQGHTLQFHVAILAGVGGDYMTIRRHISADFPDSVAELRMTEARQHHLQLLTRAQRGITLIASRNSHERNQMIDLLLTESATDGRNVMILGDGAGAGGQFPRILLPEGEHERARTITDALEHAPDILVVENASEALPFSAACRAAMRGKLVLAGLELRGTRNVLQQLLLYQQQHLFLPFFVNGLLSFKGIQLLCPHCRAEGTPPPEELAIMNLTRPPAAYYRSTGCDNCGQSGFSQRRFLLDVVVFDEGFQRAFEQTRDVKVLEQYLSATGYQGIAEEGLQLLQDGLVSPEEYIASVVL